ncbi:MAG TPA: histidine phosphatase family protein [Dehalococcoidia bacterium]|nr:histidine phosphatase family protein [Dehalococcoidia bacterium]
MATRLLLTRHGETVANAARRFSGRSDVALTALGRRQAKALGRRLRGFEIDAAYASPLLRARQTAEIALAGRGIAVTPDEGLREISFGEWEGRTFDEIRERWPNEWTRLRSFDESFCAPGGEPFTEAQQRVVESAIAIVGRHPDETVLITAHGGTLQLLLSHVLGMPAGSMFRIATGNCSLSIVEFHGERPIVTLVNDCAHTAPRTRKAQP